MSVNERLRDALYKAGLQPQELAERLRVDPKTVERWITQGRTPYRRYRVAIAQALNTPEVRLWPDAIQEKQAEAISQSEIVHVYPRRTMVPNDLWERLVTEAKQSIEILVYSGLFLPEVIPNFAQVLQRKAEEGVTVNILLGDPESDQVAERGAEEGIGNAMAEKIRNVLSFYRPLKGTSGAAVHFHRTTLYNSIYRFDDEMLVNGHVFGFPAAHAPVIHFRQLSGGEMFNRYTESFDRVWSQSSSAWVAEDGKVGVWHG